tara:strand:- start:2873 stop:3172 length:300 start_codon:yes stop_codon:yes gene_type:complete
MHEYRAKLIRCVDGDTAIFLVDCGFHIHHEITTRLVGVNTPERGKPDFKKATAMLENLIATNQDKDGWITIKTGKTGKYGRWLVDIEGVNKVLAEKWPY